jgi:hypothetical protein
MSDENETPLSQAFIWLAVPLGAVGLYFGMTDAPAGWIAVVIAGMLLLAGLIGEATRR